jgi:hypothetical protein
MGIYCDDVSCGVTVVGNIFYRLDARDGVVFSNGGHEIIVRNNVFFDCAGPAMRLTDWGYDAQTCSHRLQKLLDIRKPPYSTRYPELADWFAPLPGGGVVGMQPGGNRLQNNVVAKCRGALVLTGGRAKCASANNLELAGDPGFVNAKAMDFRLRPDAEVFRKLPGFQPIPFEKMGLYGDQYRKAPPRNNSRRREK